MSRVNALLCVVLIAFSVAACDKKNPAEPSSGGGVTIAGNVTSPVPSGLRVTVNGTSTSATVDGNGNFTLTDVPTGTADLRFTTTGVNGSIVLANLQTGDNVTMRVSVNGASVALEWSRRVNGTTEELDGRIESIGSGTFVLAARTVSTDGGTQVVVNGQQVSFSSLSAGLRVIVRGQTSGTSVRATVIDVQGTLPIVGQTVEGIMTNFSGARVSFQFIADGKSLVGDGATEFASGSLFSELGDGISVQVTAQPRDGSTFYASRIIVTSPPITFTGHIFRKTGSAPDLLLVMTARSVKTGPATMVQRKGEAQDALREGTISAGQTVEVKGRVLPDTTVIASSVNILADSEGGSFVMQGTIQGTSGTCPQLRLTVSTYELATFSMTTFTPSCGVLAVGDRVDVVGLVQADLTIAAGSITKK